MGIRKNGIMRGSFSAKRSENQEIYSNTGNNFTNLNKGPIPYLHTEQEELIITYCEFQRGKPRNAQVTKRVWLQNQLKILRNHDPHLLILPYEEDSKANGINHPGHVPQTMDQLSIYFPRMYMQSGHVTAKCRIQSSIPINQLKWRVMPQLEECNYFIRPTQLKALRTGKAGWLLGAHPDLTFRDGFQDIIPGLIKERFGKKLEFTITPEKEVIIVGTKRVEQRVLVVRCALDEVENIRVFFTEIFSEQSDFEVGYLTRYTFITSHPVGSCTKLHLQKILEAQKEFHKKVHYYIMYGIEKVDTFFPVKTETPVQALPKHTVDINDNNNHTSTNVSKDMDCSELNANMNGNSMETDEQSVISQPDPEGTSNIPLENEEQQTNEVSTNPPDHTTASSDLPSKQPSMSLRILMYLCLSEQYNDNLFHAVYPTTEQGKLYVLCTQGNRDEALVQLHHLEEAASSYFSSEVMQQIFVGHKGMKSYVKDYPKVSSHYRNYASGLVDMVGLHDNPQGGGDTSNPQEQQQARRNTYDTSPSKASVSYASSVLNNSSPKHNQSPTKRHRDGAYVTPVKHSRLPQGFESNIQENNQLNATVTESIARMRNIEQSQKDHDLKIEGISKMVENYSGEMQSMGQDISSMGSALASHSSSIKTLLEAQTAQQKTIEKMDTTLSKTQSNINEILEFNTKYILPAFTKAPHGGGETQS